MQLLNVLRQMIEDNYCRTRPTCPLASEAVYDLLRSDRRRQTIHYLVETEGPVSGRDLSHRVATLENADRKSVYITLIQGHLQKLAENEVVEYDSSQKVVIPTPRCAVLYRIDKNSQQYLE